MKLDDYKFLLIQKESGSSAVLSFNDLYGYTESGPSPETSHISGCAEGIFVRANQERSPSKDSYIPEAFRTLQISRNTEDARRGCNHELLIQYLSDVPGRKYPVLELEKFRFRVRAVSGGCSAILSMDDLVAYERGHFSGKPAGIFIRRNEDGEKTIPKALEGLLFVGNSGFDCCGINPNIDVEYASLPANGSAAPCGRPEERIPELLTALETAWRLFPDLRLGQLLCVLVKENEQFAIEDDELLERINAYIAEHS